MSADKITLESLSEAIQKGKALCELATKGPWRWATPAASTELHLMGQGFTPIVPLGEFFHESDAAFIAAHSPSFMLRVYQEMEKTLDEHQPREGMLAGVVCAACPEPYDDYGCHLEWPCAPVRSVAAMLGMETE